MKLQPDRQPTLNTVSAYGPNYIEINATRYETSLILQPEGPVTSWTCRSFNDLTIQDFEAIALKSLL